ncbi:unnamed protein product [Arabidopsis thaliana]|uniref:(thale cress) hypothetical protein n=1 Tax=Arabidopsis thaliana TaxID=3702 RepID=A0A7G2E8U5_ARATH|nr:unnamed protein product [Arabidopsis thaliana]
MDQVILVCGNSQTSYDDFIQMVYEDYNIEKSVFEVILSYKISKSKQLPADTPPVLIGNNRQFQSYLGQTKNDTVRLCVELKEKVLDESEEEIIDDLGSSDLPKTKAVDVYGIVEENVDVFTHTDNVVEGKKSEAVEDGEDDGSRFEYCDDSDGTDSDDENFSLYGIPPEEEDKTKSRVEHAKLLSVQDIDANQVQVTFGASLHVVNLKDKKCSCRRFDLENIPCAHAIAAAEKRKLSRISLCHPYFQKNYLCKSYANAIMPRDFDIPVPENVVSKICLPPEARQQPGRPKKSRIKSALEIAMEKKKPRRQHTCGNCKQIGHNRKTYKA